MLTMAADRMSSHCDAQSRDSRTVSIISDAYLSPRRVAFGTLCGFHT